VVHSTAVRCSATSGASVHRGCGFAALTRTAGSVHLREVHLRRLPRRARPRGAAVGRWRGPLRRRHYATGLTFRPGRTWAVSPERALPCSSNGGARCWCH